jgi:phospholipid/cholesterol/gamma-HCH transport system ATP-binding protein
MLHFLYYLLISVFKNMSDVVISIQNLSTKFGNHVIHDQLCLDIHQGEILGLVGGSGTGKSILLNTILGLQYPIDGTINVLGANPFIAEDYQKLTARWGVLFQTGALFSSMTAGENIEVPMREIARIPQRLLKELAYMRLAMVGLTPDTYEKYPSQLSGGMIKRVALARALAIDPELLFLDEPTSGLDPISAAAFDNLLKALQRNLNLTVVMITHDLDSLYANCDRIAVLVDKVVIVDTVKKIHHYPHPWIQEYFHGQRGQKVFEV